MAGERSQSDSNTPCNLESEKYSNKSNEWSASPLSQRNLSIIISTEAASFRGNLSLQFNREKILLWSNMN